MSDNKHVPTPPKDVCLENKERRENTGCDYDPGSTTAGKLVEDYSDQPSPLAPSGEKDGDIFFLVKTKHPRFVHTMRMRGIDDFCCNL